MATKKVARNKQAKAEPQFSAARAVQLYATGKNVSEIAQAFGYPKGKGNNRTRAVLITAGVYKKETTPKRRVKQTPRTARPKPVTTLGVPNDSNTALMVCLRTVAVNMEKLGMDESGRGKFARSLMGMIATNFGVQDFQVRRPVLVIDEERARGSVMQVAQA